MAAPGVFPTDTAGGLVTRDPAGNPTNPPAVENAHVPLPPFIITCPPTALPSDCTARIEPRQINAIVSELVSFAECMDPNGPWDCASLKNLCAAFTAWQATLTINEFLIVADAPPPPPDPNTLWWESDTGYLFIWYDDGNTQQWVQIVGGNPIVVDKVSIIGTGTTVDPYKVDLVDCGAY